MGEGGSGGLGSKILIVFNKKSKGKWRREDPEASGAISLLFLIRKLKANGGGRIRRPAMQQVHAKSNENQEKTNETNEPVRIRIGAPLFPYAPLTYP